MLFLLRVFNKLEMLQYRSFNRVAAARSPLKQAVLGQILGWSNRPQSFANNSLQLRNFVEWSSCVAHNPLYAEMDVKQATVLLIIYCKTVFNIRFASSIQVLNP